MLQHLIIHFSLYLPLYFAVPLREVKNRRKFQTFSAKSGRGRGRLRVVFPYKRLQM